MKVFPKFPRSSAKFRGDPARNEPEKLANCLFSSSYRLTYRLKLADKPAELADIIQEPVRSYRLCYRLKIADNWKELADISLRVSGKHIGQGLADMCPIKKPSVFGSSYRLSIADT